MLFQVLRDYNGISNYRDLTIDEMEFFYSGLIPELKESTKPKNN